MKRIVLIFWTTITYAVIDIGWNIFFIPVYTTIYEAFGSDRSFVRDSITDGGTAGLLGILMFFILIGWANVQFAIVPGIRARRVSKAAANAFLFGCAAYATYIAPQYLTIAGTPPSLIIIDTLIGGGLSLVTSVILTRLYIKRSV